MDHDDIELIVAGHAYTDKVERTRTSPVLAKNLSPLPTVWAAVRDILGFCAMDAIGFVEERILEMQPPLYTDEGHTDALPRAFLLGWEFGPFGSLNGQRLSKASVDNFASWWGNDKPKYMEEPDDGAALHLYLSPPDADALVNAAKAVAGAKPLSLGAATTDAHAVQLYPDELRAAVEAFEAVRDDANALRGVTPKTALLAWLSEHKPELSNGARERIATVANWQPGGGAPRTPG